jgi:ActR/RegA family two-component response regulator
MTVRKPASTSSLVPEKLRVLLVQANATDTPNGLRRALERKGHDVTVKTTISDSLACVTGERFAALICDLHLPAAGDGFTLVNAMHHCHPEAVTMVLSSYPALKESLVTLLPQADEVLVTPIPNQEIVELLEARLRVPKQQRVRSRESIATILERYRDETVGEWLKRTKDTKTLSAAAALPDGDRTGYLKALLSELVHRLRSPRLEEGTAGISNAAIAHGRVRKQQGYTSAMLVEESRILQVCIFHTLRNNLNAVDLALVLTDVMTIADEVDSQLRQTMDSFSQITNASRAG